MKHRQVVMASGMIVALLLIASLLTACDGGGDNAKTPPPTPTWTPAPRDAITIPGVETNSGQSEVQVSPLATPDPASPLPSPTSTP
ncbi:MAG: hypothetical protein WA040_17575 [Anaerolineae bacterium]